MAIFTIPLLELVKDAKGGAAKEQRKAKRYMVQTDQHKASSDAHANVLQLVYHVSSRSQMRLAQPRLNAGQFDSIAKNLKR